MSEQAIQERQERRQSRRAKSIRGGQIVYQDGNCVMDCLILDLSDSGARIRPADLIKCPSSFTLRMTDGSARRCVVVRRSPSELGLRFLKPEAVGRSTP
jgi:hypothetical protein